MNNIPYENFEIAARRAFKTLLEHNYVYKNEHITEDGIVHIIAGEMLKAQEQANQAITVNLIQEYLPDVFARMLKEANQTKTSK